MFGSSLTRVSAPVALSAPQPPQKQTPPPQQPAPDETAPKASENTNDEARAAGKGKAPPSPEPAPAPAPATAPASEKPSRSAESRVLVNATPEVAEPDTAATTPAQATLSSESGRLDEMRAALAVVTEIAENPVSDRIEKLFAASETAEADESDDADAGGGDPQSSIRSEQAREAYSTTRSLAADKDAA